MQVEMVGSGEVMSIRLRSFVQDSSICTILSLHMHTMMSNLIVILSSITMTVFFRTRMEVNYVHANKYLGALFYSLIILVVNGFSELSMTVARLAVFYKQRELCFYPAWGYAIPVAIIKIPLSLLEAVVWVSLTYYVIGYNPKPGRFFRHLILLFAVHWSSVSMFRLVASVCWTMVATLTTGSLSILLVLTFGGFIIPKPLMLVWLKWTFWLSPVTYGEIGLSVNEFLAPRWQKMLPTNTTIGKETLESHGLDFEGYYYWISLGALFGFILFFNIGFILALSFLKPTSSRAIISSEKLSRTQGSEDRVEESITTGRIVLPLYTWSLS